MSFWPRAKSPLSFLYQCIGRMICSRWPKLGARFLEHKGSSPTPQRITKPVKIFIFHFSNAFYSFSPAYSNANLLWANERTVFVNSTLVPRVQPISPLLSKELHIRKKVRDGKFLVIKRSFCLCRRICRSTKHSSGLCSWRFPYISPLYLEFYGQHKNKLRYSTLWDDAQRQWVVCYGRFATADVPKRRLMNCPLTPTPSDDI